MSEVVELLPHCEKACNNMTGYNLTTRALPSLSWSYILPKLKVLVFPSSKCENHFSPK